MRNWVLKILKHGCQRKFKEKIMNRHNGVLFRERTIEIAKNLNDKDCGNNDTNLNWDMITEGLRFQYCIIALKGE